MTRADEDYTLKKINEALGGKWIKASSDYFDRVEKEIASGIRKRRGRKEIA